MYSQAAHGAGRASSGCKQTELVAAGGSKVLAASEKAAFLKSHQKVVAFLFRRGSRKAGNTKRRAGQKRYVSDSPKPKTFKTGFVLLHSSCCCGCSVLVHGLSGE